MHRTPHTVLPSFSSFYYLREYAVKVSLRYRDIAQMLEAFLKRPFVDVHKVQCAEGELRVLLRCHVESLHDVRGMPQGEASSVVGLGTNTFMFCFVNHICIVKVEFDSLNMGIGIPNLFLHNRQV